MVEWWTCDQKVSGFMSWQELWENFLLRGQLPVLSLISVFVPHLCYCSSIYIKDPSHSAKSAGSRFQLNKHAACIYVALNKVTVNWCMAVWCT